MNNFFYIDVLFTTSEKYSYLMDSKLDSDEMFQQLGFAIFDVQPKKFKSKKILKWNGLSFSKLQQIYNYYKKSANPTTSNIIKIINSINFCDESIECPKYNLDTFIVFTDDPNLIHKT